MLFPFFTLIYLFQVVPVFGRLSITTREACVTYWGKETLEGNSFADMDQAIYYHAYAKNIGLFHYDYDYDAKSYHPNQV